MVCQTVLALEQHLAVSTPPTKAQMLQFHVHAVWYELLQAIDAPMLAQRQAVKLLVLRLHLKGELPKAGALQEASRCAGCHSAQVLQARPASLRAACWRKCPSDAMHAV